MHLSEMLLVVVVESSYSTLGAPLDYYSQARRAALFSPRAAFLGTAASLESLKREPCKALSTTKGWRRASVKS